PLQALPRLRLAGGPGHLDERHAGPPAPGGAARLARGRWRGAARPSFGGLDPGWLTGLLVVVRWPGCVAKTGRLVLVRQGEQRRQRARRVVHRLPRVAE